jgi:hypothetical protein
MKKLTPKMADDIIGHDVSGTESVRACCEVPVSWLIQLYELSEKCKKDQDEWVETTKNLLPTSFSILIGFSSSAENLIKYNKK